MFLKIFLCLLYVVDLIAYHHWIFLIIMGLRDLGCTANNLSALDVSNNNIILFLTCAGNHIEELDLSLNFSLYWFMCHDNEELTFLDLRNGGNSGLSLMWAQNTPNLKCILVDNKNFADSKECGFPTSGWCKDGNDLFIEDMVDCVLSSEDFAATEIVLYPNPVRNRLQILGVGSVKKVKIYTLQGSLISESNTGNIDVSSLTSGLYFAEIIAKNGRQIKKFMKK